MNAPHDSSEGNSLLELLAGTLENDARRFRPANTAEGVGRLPGRRPGTNLADGPEHPVGAAAVIVECGTSRLPAYTHVLWVSPSAESILGSRGHELMGELIGRVDGVTGYAWEGPDRLHVRAPEHEWHGVLSDARRAVSDYLDAL